LWGVKLKAKKTQKKKLTKKKSGIKKYNNEIVGIILLALGLLTVFGLFAEDSIGIFGTFIKTLILGLMGWLGYVVPLFIIFYSILVIFRKNNERVNSKIRYIFVLILIMSAMVQTLFYNEQDYINKGAVECIKKFLMTELPCMAAVCWEESSAYLSCCSLKSRYGNNSYHHCTD